MISDKTTLPKGMMEPDGAIYSVRFDTFVTCAYKDVIISTLKYIAQKLKKSEDSDVVLLSDDETDLCCPILSSWQCDILSQTWPVPDKDIVLHLGQDTGLSEDFVLDWYQKKTDSELERLWDELQKHCLCLCLLC